MNAELCCFGIKSESGSPRPVLHLVVVLRSRPTTPSLCCISCRYWTGWLPERCRFSPSSCHDVVGVVFSCFWRGLKEVVCDSVKKFSSHKGWLWYKHINMTLFRFDSVLRCRLIRTFGTFEKKEKARIKRSMSQNYPWRVFFLFLCLSLCRRVVQDQIE